MEEAWCYSSDGKDPRAEYAPLSNERRMGAYFDISEGIEALLDVENRPEDAHLTIRSDAASTVREVYIESTGITPESEMLWAELETGIIKRLCPTVRKAENRSVTVHHERFRGGSKLEEYIFAVDREIEGTLHRFYATYTLELYVGGAVQTHVYTNNVSPYEDIEGASQERAMTEYDIAELEGEIAETLSYVESAGREAALSRAYRLAME